jgi:anti-sigma regulatory factor (Ser/Thr protein kinase)
MAAAGASAGSGGDAAGDGHTGGGATRNGSAGNGNGSATTAVWEVPCSPAAAGRARRELGRLLEHHGVDLDDVDVVLLVAHELVVNGVEHGRTAVRLTVVVHRASARIEVRDGSASPPELRPFDPTAPRGRGMQMVAGLAADWGWHPDGVGKTVWAEVPLDGNLGPRSGPAA